MDGKKKDVRGPPTPKFESNHPFIEVELLVRYVSSVVWRKIRNKRILKILLISRFLNNMQNGGEKENNSVFNLVDWLNERQKMAHKTYKGTFFKDTFLLSQKIIEKEDAGRVEDDNEPSNSDESNETLLRKSTRKSLQYQSTLTGRKCIICNEDRYSKGHLIPLINLSLATPEGQYKAEATLKKFAKIIIPNMLMVLNLYY